MRENEMDGGGIDEGGAEETKRDYYGTSFLLFYPLLYDLNYGLFITVF